MKDQILKAHLGTRTVLGVQAVSGSPLSSAGLGNLGFKGKKNEGGGSLRRNGLRRECEEYTVQIHVAIVEQGWACQEETVNRPKAPARSAFSKVCFVEH